MADDLDKTLAQGDDGPAQEPGGTPEKATDATAPMPEGQTTQPMPAATKPLPTAVDAPTRDDTPQGEAADARGAPRPLAQRLRERLAPLAAFLATHRLAAGMAALACVAAVLGAVLWGVRAAQVPSDSLVVADARARLAPPEHTSSAYEVDEPLVLQSVEVTRKRTSGTRNDACDADLVATFANSAMETRAEARLTYVRSGDSWSCTAASVGSASHRATAGVSQGRVLEQLRTLLEAADTDDATTSLASLYRGATVSLVGENFVEDAQTDTLILHCQSQGTFVSYECDLTAHFRFVQASGAWELVEAVASDGAYDLGFGPLVGTWRGTFVHQRSTSEKCLAARDAGLTVVVGKAVMGQGGDATIAGTLTGVAHLHPDLQADASSTEGDTELDRVPFAGRISSGEVEQDVLGLLAGNNPKRDVAGIVFECTTQDVAGGKVTLTLTFGTAEAPDAATATLTSTHSYEDTFLLLVPYQRDARFADTFTLEREP